MRISTPNLHWVILTHFSRGEVEFETRVRQTFSTNRAFHGWGHQFLYTEQMLNWLLTELGYVQVSFHAYGESEDPGFVGLERHGGYSVHKGQPSVIIAEATRGDRPTQMTRALQDRLVQGYVRYLHPS